MTYTPLEVKVYGDYACFTRPEQKIERVSYEVMTPSAARGILEAIFFHKPMKWRVREIAVLKPVRHFSILRNELVKPTVTAIGDDLIKDWRSQRHTLALRDVEYIIKADVWLSPGATDRDGSPVDPAKYRDQFRRRVQRGQCYWQPYLGCREFSAFFSLPDGTEKPINVTASLGRMLLDIEYGEGGKNEAHYFNAELDGGRLIVPQEDYGRIQHTGEAA